MKNLSSDIAYYRQIGNAIILCAFFILFVTQVFKDSQTGQWIFGCIGVVLETLVIRGLFNYKKITYDSNAIYIKPYLTGNAFEVPLTNVIGIEKAPVASSYSTMSSARLIFSDGVQTKKIRFYLAYSLYSVVNLNSFIGVGMEASPAFKASMMSPIGAEVDRGKRLISAMTDQLVMTMIMMVFSIPYFAYVFTHIHTSHEINIYTLSADDWYVYILDIGFAIYFCKDCIRGQSPGKYIFKFQVVNNKTGEVASPFRCLARDIFIILWPIEAVALLINPSRRLGDVVAGTKVVAADFEPKHLTLDFPRQAIVFMLAYPVMPLAAYAIDKLLGR